MANTVQPKPLELQTSMEEAVTSFEQYLEPEEEKLEEAQVESQADETVEEEIVEEEELQADDFEETEETETLDDEQDEIEEQNEPQLYAVKVNGEDVEVTIDELQSSYSRQADYTRKTQELAQQRKTVEEQQSEVAKNEAIYKELLPKMEAALSESLGTEPDWETLYSNDPIGYVRERDLWNEKQQKLQAVQAEQTRLQEEDQVKQQEQIQKYMQYGEKQILNHVPEWKDKTIQQEEKLAIRDHAINDLGFTAEEINQVYDYRLLMGLRNSWMQNKTQKAVKKKPTQKASARNRVAKPGSVSRKKTSTPLKKSKARLAKSGKVQDAAKVFEQLI
ncbi:MAG: putative scaffolding protein [Prokaryotic dsDNA virus sp.]|jgi:hypothetical protein|nr:MAG: putative scaffolding protein [Prokaryotic dsDNA virus sp.]|tara:strand:+ start:957 stop:1958 length:1002 start_codon:yes stop_codon:yes gene_type:complete